MAVKTLLSASPLLWLLSLNAGRGLQGAEASPVGNTFPEQLHTVRSQYPEKTSFIQETLSGDLNLDPKKTEYSQENYNGILVTGNLEGEIKLSVIYVDGWLVHNITIVTYWNINTGKSLLSLGGTGDDNWDTTWLFLTDFNYGLFDIVVNL
jgi:hypothetical protein